MIGKTVSHYRILEKIGGGGMGVVYKAENTRLKKIVALKFLPPDTTRDEDTKHRFMHEARAASALEHPNICTIHDIGETEDGQLFIVMSYYEGQTLKSKVESAPLSVGESTSLILQIADGLSKAHDKGIIHRDIKPDNIMVTESGEVKLLDFGLAKLAGQTQVTMEGTTLGTAAYMSPEQARGEIVDLRTDIFSLSVIFYQLLSGHHPFEAEHQLATMYAIINEDPIPIRNHSQDISESLALIVEKGMAKNLDQRYGSLYQMIEDLNKLVEKPVVEKKIKTKISGKSKIIISFAIVSVLVIAVASFIFLTQTDGSQEQIWKFYNEQAVTRMENGDNEGAESALLRSLELNAKDASTWNTLAALHIRMRKLDAAIEESKKAIHIDKNFGSAYYNLAFAQEELGQYEKAIINYQSTIGVDSLFTPAYSALGNLYLKQNQAETALRILQQAEKRTPDSKYLYLIWKNIGKAYYQLNDFERSVSYLEKSKESQPAEMPETYYYLSLSLEHLGRFIESREYMESYLQYETDDQKRQSAKQRLQRQK